MYAIDIKMVSSILFFLPITDTFFESALIEIQPSTVITSNIEIPFSIPNDNIGLQDNVTATLTIQSASSDSVIIDDPSTATVTITDDERMLLPNCKLPI